MKRTHRGDGGAADRGTEESVVQRWSRRKLGSSADASQAEPELVSSSDSSQLQPTAEQPDRVLTDADMPSVQQLDDRSDVSQFFSPGVSQELRRLALRKVFHLPAFNLRDGLDDYDDDFTSFAALGNTMTADLRHRLEMEARRKQEVELAASDVGQEAGRNRVAELEQPDEQHESSEEEPVRASAPEKLQTLEQEQVWSPKSPSS